MATHDWRRGPLMDGNPTMVCIACDLVWLPDQSKPSDRSCGPRQDARKFRRRPADHVGHLGFAHDPDCPACEAGRFA